MRNRTTLLRAEQSRAWADCALFAPCEAFETEYSIYDKNIHWMFLLCAKARDG